MTHNFKLSAKYCPPVSSTVLLVRVLISFSFDAKRFVGLQEYKQCLGGPELRLLASVNLFHRPFELASYGVRLGSKLKIELLIEDSKVESSSTPIQMKGLHTVRAKGPITLTLSCSRRKSSGVRVPEGYQPP